MVNPVEAGANFFLTIWAVLPFAVRSFMALVIGVVVIIGIIKLVFNK